MKALAIKLLLIIIAFGILSFFAWLTLPFLLDLTQKQSFLLNFLANFWSTVLAGSLLAPIIIAVIERAKRLEAKMIYMHPEAEVVANEAVLDDSKRCVHLSIWNKQGTFEETIYWHIFVEEKRFVEVKAPHNDCVLKSYDNKITFKGRRFRHIRGRLCVPVYPDTYNDVLFVTVRATKGERPLLYYYLSTRKGIFPKGVNKDDPKTFAEVELLGQENQREFKPIRVLPITKNEMKRVEKDYEYDKGFYRIPFRLSNDPPRAWTHIFLNICKESRPIVEARINQGEIELFCAPQDISSSFIFLQERISATNEDYSALLQQDSEKEREEKKQEEIDRREINSALEKLDYS